MTRGMRVAKSGRSSASNKPEDLVYTSESLSPKVVKKYVGSVTTNSAGSAKVDIPHGLAYAPACLAYLNPTVSNVNDSYPMTKSWGLIDNSYAFVQSNPQVTTIDFDYMKPRKTYQFCIFIFADVVT